MGNIRNLFLSLFFASLLPGVAQAALNIPLTVNMSEAVTVDTTGGAPRIPVDVGGSTRYATYTSGSGTSTLTFTLTPTVGDVDLDGVSVSSPLDLNGGTIKDAAGNNATLTFTPPNTTGIKVDHPSLSMDFANSDYILSGTHYATLPSFLTAAGGSFTRSSVGTYYDSSGVLQTASSGTPRFDYDPITHTAKGILIEESRTNLATYSTRMDNAVWSFGGTKATGGAAPDGSTDATYYSGPSAATTASRLIAGAATSTTMTYSVYAKYVSGGTSRIFLLRNSTTATNFNACNFNLSTGTISSGCTGWTISSVGNGWYRLAYTQSTGITVGDGLIIYFGDTGAALAAGDSWLVWGAQLEAGAFATSFIPTTSTTVTRAADVLTAPIGSWANALQGSIFSSFDSQTDSSNKLVYRWGTGVGSIGPYARLGSVVVDKSSTGTLFTQSGSFSGSGRHALSYDSSGIYGSLNAGAVGSSGLTSPSSPTALYFGSENTPLHMLNGHISKLKYYPLRAPDTQLQLLTQ